MSNHIYNDLKLVNDVWDLAIIGGGFRTTTFLAHAPELLKYKVAILEKRNTIGPGAFQDYTITTSSSGKSMLKYLSYRGPFEKLKKNQNVRTIANCEGPIRTEDLSAALNEIGTILSDTLDNRAISVNTNITKIIMNSVDGLVTLHSEKGETTYAKHVLIATGRTERPHSELRTWKNKTILSQSIISRGQRNFLEDKLLSTKEKPVVIAGCSHSAMSALQVIMEVMSELEYKNPEFIRPKIIILQRSLTPLMYENEEEALKNQEVGRERIFNASTDVCPETGIVFRDSGLRHISKDLYCQLFARNINNTSILRIEKLSEASSILEDSAFIVQALGYHGNAPDIYMDDKLIRSTESKQRFITDEYCTAIINGQECKSLSVLRIEPTPINRKDNTAYGSNLYERLASRLGRYLSESTKAGAVK